MSKRTRVQITAASLERATASFGAARDRARAKIHKSNARVAEIEEKIRQLQDALAAAVTTANEVKDRAAEACRAKLEEKKAAAQRHAEAVEAERKREEKRASAKTDSPKRSAATVSLPTGEKFGISAVQYTDVRNRLPRGSKGTVGAYYSRDILAIVRRATGRDVTGPFTLAKRGNKTALRFTVDGDFLRFETVPQS